MGGGGEVLPLSLEPTACIHPHKGGKNKGIGNITSQNYGNSVHCGLRPNWRLVGMKEDLGLQRGNGVMLVISEKEKNMLKEII